jgi:putative ABC transport system permease protein
MSRPGRRWPHLPVWWWWLAHGQWRQSPGRALVCVASIAIGVALALGIHLINASALEEFRQAMATVNGESHAQLRAVRGTFEDGLWVDLEQDRPAGLEASSPVLETDITLEGPRGESLRLRLIGLDVLAAAEVTPGLLPGADTPRLLEAATIALSLNARNALGVEEGQSLHLRLGARLAELKVVATLPDDRARSPLAVMDLGHAQWLLSRVGQISRIDLRLASGADIEGLQATLDAQGRGQWLWGTAQDGTQRMSNLSRAYRVNLNVLALVALFTGAFLVFSTLALAVARQTPELALLGVLGASAIQRAAAVLVQGLLLGALGALGGVIGGIGLAQLVLRALGGDLGGGYFDGAQPVLHADLLTLAGFAMLGLLTGLVGAWAPAAAVARMPAAQTLRSARADPLMRGRTRWQGAALLALTGLGLLASPAVFDLPLPAYGTIALWLLAGIMVLPAGIGRIAQSLMAALAFLQIRPGPWTPPVWLALQRAAQTPQALAAGLAGVVASVALASAMGIMVHSFRVSVSLWLDEVLPAPLYARLASPPGAGLSPDDLNALRRHPEVLRLQAMKTIELQVGAGQPPVALLVRDTGPDAPGSALPLTGPRLTVPAGLIPIRVSEPLAHRWALQPGDRLALDPLRADPAGLFFIEGVWRDYARQHGALALEASHWRALHGEISMTDLALWPTDPADLPTLPQRLSALSPSLQALEWRSAREIRELSLKIFDRSFAVTYALEAVALLVGLFGVAAACASDALARMREFGMLRHLGLGVQAARRQLHLEAILGTGLAVLWGMVLGLAIGWVLIARVNPQSFHWTMQMHIPWLLLAAGATGLLMGAGLSARLASRAALGKRPLDAVRQDA